MDTISTLEDLIKYELDGKQQAIGDYDRIIWKIRSGYSVFLYSGIGVLIALLNNKVLDVNTYFVSAIVIIIIGFSSFGAALENIFMRSKLHVVEDRDGLVCYLYKLLSDKGQREQIQDEELIRLLQNSGERKDRTNSREYKGVIKTLIMYGGTASVAITAMMIVVWPLLKC